MIKKIGGAAIGAVGGNLAGRYVANSMNKGLKARQPELQEKAKKEDEKIKGYSDELFKMKLKSGLTPADIEKLNSLKAKMIRLSRKPTLNSLQIQRLHQLQARLKQLEELKKESERHQREQGGSSMASRGVNLASGMAAEGIQSEINSIQEKGMKKSAKLAEKAAKKRAKLKKKMKMTPEQAHEYEQLKAKVRAGNASQRDLNRLKAKISKRNGWSQTLGTIGGAALGFGAGHMAEKRYSTSSAGGKVIKSTLTGAAIGAGVVGGANKLGQMADRVYVRRMDNLKSQGKLLTTKEARKYTDAKARLSRKVSSARAMAGGAIVGGGIGAMYEDSVRKRLKRNIQKGEGLKSV